MEEGWTGPEKRNPVHPAGPVIRSMLFEEEKLARRHGEKGIEPGGEDGPDNRRTRDRPEEGYWSGTGGDQRDDRGGLC
jgi:hypothetical protein